MELYLNGKVSYKLEAADGAYDITAELIRRGDLDTICVAFQADAPVIPPIIEMRWEIPSVNIQGLWHPTCHTQRGIPRVGTGDLYSSSACSAPLACLFSSSGNNRMTYACSDAMNTVMFRFVLREEDSTWLCSTQLFATPTAAIEHYTCDFRVDYSPIRYEEAICNVVNWWASMPEYAPMETVDECTHPLYSTWYSFHQKAYGSEIEEVLRSAAPLGFRAVIVDDGWQMEDYARSYAYCGDWEVAPAKIPDMKAHVQRVHEMGLKYYLWYSVPFIGMHSKAYKKFEGKFLYHDSDAGILDPRYPDVREYLIHIYENAVKEWDLDGFKLDFIDKFGQPAQDAPDAPLGKDYISVGPAVDRLMTDIKLHLQALKPNIAIEFRQNYIGPLMRKYGNMFRAADCANDTVINKVRTIDTKLCVGDSTVHSDMLTWHRADTPEAVALQFINTMFSVPQISVRPTALPEEHLEVMRAWIHLWEKYRETILSGTFRAQNPELLYTSASAESKKQYVAAAFADHTVIPAPAGCPSQIFLANGSGRPGVFLQTNAGQEHYTSVIRNALGKECSRRTLSTESLTYLEIPVGGTAELTRTSK